MRLALLIRGFHFLWKDRMGFPLDARRCADSLARCVIEPLRREHNLDLYFVTYDSPILADLRQRLHPAAVRVLDPRTSNQPSTFLAGLELIEESDPACERIICTRFDLHYRKNASQWPIWNGRQGIYFPWREYEELWDRDHRVGDTIHVVDRTHLPFFKEGMGVMKAHPVGHLHYLYDAIAPLTPDLLFIEPGFYDSNTLYWNRECWNPLYRIANRPHLPITQPYTTAVETRPLTTAERLHWRVATLLMWMAAWIARLLFRPGFAAPVAAGK